MRCRPISAPRHARARRWTIRAARGRDGAGRRHRRLSGARRRAPAGATCAMPTCSTSAPSTDLRGIARGRRTHAASARSTTWTDLIARRRCRRCSTASSARRARSAACRSRTAARWSATSAPPRRPATACPACWRSTPRSSLRAATAAPRRADGRVHQRLSPHRSAAPTRSSPRCSCPSAAAARAAISSSSARGAIW